MVERGESLWGAVADKLGNNDSQRCEDVCMRGGHRGGQSGECGGLKFWLGGGS
jgi:hypothetical protein